MATLKQELKFLDTIFNKVDKKEVYLVLHETLHNLWVIDLEGKKEPKEIPKRMVNLAFIKAEQKTVQVLYGEKEEVTNENPVVNTDSK